ncbi:hypothetical protein [Lysinibacillus xylanilyticus]|uniref:hypothetical protein n=1 Tax=Lysinibacillus xylanilyticus TaxID=582475 RepID=UPI003D0710FF
MFLGIGNSRTNDKSIPPCDNAFVTNIVLFRESTAKQHQQQCFICAKAKRQQQQCFNCAKAKRQQQQCFICAKAKRQQQKWLIGRYSVGTEINHTL